MKIPRNRPALNPPDRPEMNPLDPLDVNGRLYRAMSTLLDNFDDMAPREQVLAISAIARIQVLFMKIREEPGASPHTGSAVRKYEQAFKENAARGGKRIKPRSDDILAAFEQFEDNERLANGLE